MVNTASTCFDKYFLKNFNTYFYDDTLRFNDCGICTILNSDFFDDYLNRWQDLANGYLSCDTMIAILDSMINVIDPEMPRQIAKWGGTYTASGQASAMIKSFCIIVCWFS